MPPRKAKKTFKVVALKKGKVAKASRLTIPLTLGLAAASSASGSSALTSSNGANAGSSEAEGDFPLLDVSSELQRKKPRLRKVKIKSKLKAYHVRKSRLAESWLKVREQLVSALLETHTLPIGQLCVLPECKVEAVGRCLDCGPAQFFCEAHLSFVHAGGRSLHRSEVWKDGRYVPYEFEGDLIWTTPHNMDHGYVREITAVNINGQHRINLKCCDHEPEAVTLIKNGFWPSTPKHPQVAFDLKLMEMLRYLFLECRVSLKTLYQALQWLIPSLSQVYVKDIYRLLVGDCFSEFRYLSSILDNMTQFNAQLNNESECPACPKIISPAQ